MSDKMRVQKFLSKAGHCSRREGEALMRQGRVQVNGELCRELGSKVDPSEDLVEVDDRPITLPDQYRYILVHKPEDYVTTLDDPQGRPTITDLLPDNTPRLWPVGRLDLDSSGLILMTNDGKLTHRLTHPSFEARKRYRVIVEGRMAADSSEIAQLQAGVRLEDGYTTEPADAEVLDYDGHRTILSMTLTEGKNRQIRHMGEAIGFPVVSLERTAVGPVSDEDLESGQWRDLTDQEVESLYDEVDADSPPRAT